MMHRLPYILLVLLTLGACSNMQIEDFAGTGPELKPEEYFAGQTKAWGMFEDRFGNLKREFVVDIQGDWDGTTLTLIEDFDYSDGEQEQRIWRITRKGDGLYEGRADDVVGTAQGIARGKALNWSYDLMLKVGESEIKVRFNDWMFLQPGGVMINKAEVSKFGITIGTVTLFFAKDAANHPGSFSGRKSAA
ncbi:DUF3833 domain-containing protein [Nisaea acidiphila]|uniref:DUF3833 domain-containing protein n=1 Tax=Nisaea acidiphila TaxID=1862145 RepID=A0A9J7ATE5_9PROT|nr:DUF3833 domain-containing protein [Nisaea acidiphila]UUX49753.1 DUF3833 domain-containing protein [Nisaea acidiphila]